MRWGKGIVEKKLEPTHQLWFAWYPIRLYEGRWLWWEWTIRGPGYFTRYSYECFFDGKRPDCTRYCK